MSRDQVSFCHSIRFRLDIKYPTMENKRTIKNMADARAQGA